MVETAFATFNLREILTVEALPGMPVTASRLIRLSRDPANGPAEFAVLIEADLGLTAQVLRFVNSSYFGFRSQISSIKQAIMLLGINTIKNFVLWHAIFTVIPNPRCCLFDLKALWRDSLRCALFARARASCWEYAMPKRLSWRACCRTWRSRCWPGYAPEAYGRFFFARCTSKHRVRLSQLEEHVFGWNHAMAAGVVARKWQLPETLITLIENHLAIAEDLFQSKSNFGKLAVAMSALLPADDDLVWMELSKLEAAYAQVRPLEGPFNGGFAAQGR